MIHFSSVEISINFLLVFSLLFVYYLEGRGHFAGRSSSKSSLVLGGHFRIRDHYLGGGGGQFNKSYDSSTK